ncbi:MAG: class I SAM-dependent methyltransferase, partial [Ktedonobacteraceae bacterium]|nr:class I SAM-dependent methyltransferase [Ktedonobacteraceae bacterium]
RVPIHERACRVGNITAIHAYRANRELLTQRLLEGGYRLHTTPHFLLCVRPAAPSVIVVHWFAPTAVDANIGHYIMRELRPLGLPSDQHDYSDLFAAIVCALAPQDAPRAMRLYATNTLHHYRELLNSNIPHPLPDSPIGIFSTLYRRVLAHLSGERLLDAGCSFGFLPLLAAEYCPTLTQAVGLDIEAGSFSIMRALADEQQLAQVRFVQGNLLAAGDVTALNHFDTVTLLHVLEHFTEDDMYRLLSHLLPIVERHLLIAVPYEVQMPEAAYGHRQLFDRAKLLALGEWCLQQWQGAGSIRYEDCADGLLVVERY